MPSADDLTTQASTTTVDFYALLSLHATATETEIRSAFRRTTLKYHPDKVGDTPDNVDKFLLVKVAYDVLSDPKIRALYDQSRLARIKREVERERLEGGRRRMVSDLERREGEAFFSSSSASPSSASTGYMMGVKRSRYGDEESAEQKLQREIARIAEENRRKKRDLVDGRERERLEEEERRADEEEARARLLRQRAKGGEEEKKKSKRMEMEMEMEEGKGEKGGTATGHGHVRDRVQDGHRSDTTPSMDEMNQPRPTPTPKSTSTANGKDNNDKNNSNRRDTDADTDAAAAADAGSSFTKHQHQNQQQQQPRKDASKFEHSILERLKTAQRDKERRKKQNEEEVERKQGQALDEDGMESR